MRRKLLLAGLVLALGLVAAALARSCRSERRFAQRWTLVRTGMSKAEVEAILGLPDSVYPAGMVQSGSFLGSLVGNYMFDSVFEKWAYGRRRMLESQPEFPFVGLAFDGFMSPEDGDYVVYFSDEGKVLKMVHPYRKHANR